jgi:hypothetical protein
MNSPAEPVRKMSTPREALPGGFNRAQSASIESSGTHEFAQW